MTSLVLCLSTNLDGLGGTSGAGVLPSPTPLTRGGAGDAPLCLVFCLGGSSGGALDCVGGVTPDFSVPCKE